MLFVELVKDVDGCLWHCGMIGNRRGLNLDYFGRLAMENAKSKTENIAGGGEPIA
jgi:hypothetical protein